MSHSASSSRSGNVIGGSILIAIGIWFLLSAFGVDLPRIGSLWPIFPTLGGLAFIAAYMASSGRNAGLLVPGVGGFLLGVFFFLITVGPFRWRDMDSLWPVFPLIGGITFVVVWWADGQRERGLLVPAGLGMGVGVVGLVATLGGLRASLIARLWPVILVVVGVYLLTQGFVAGSRSK